MLRTLFDKAFPFRGLTRDAYILFFARIVNRFGDFISFFLTLYLTRVLNLQPSQAGLLITAATVSGMIGSLVSGRVSDSVSRKLIMVSSQTIHAAIMCVCGLYPNASWIPAALVAGYLFQGAVRPASQALVTDLTPARDRIKVFGLLYLGINIGVSLGPLVAGFLFDHHRRWIFWGSSIATVISVVLVTLFVKEAPREAVHLGSRMERADGSGAFKALMSRPVLLKFVLVMMLAHFIYAQVQFALPLLVDAFFPSSSPQKFGVMMSINALTVIVVTPLFISLFKKRRPGQNMVLGALCYAVGFGCLAIIPKAFLFVVLSTIVWTFGEILFATNARVFSAAYTPSNHRGRFASIEQLAWGLGTVLAPTIAGWVIGMLGVRGMWPIIFILSAVVAMLLRQLDRIDATKINR